MIKLLPVKEHEYDAIIKRSIKGFAEESVAAGRWTDEEAYGHAKSMLERELTVGINTPGHFFFNLFSDDMNEVVGYLWVEILTKDNLPTLYISDIEIETEFRRNGLATQAFLAIEKLAAKKDIKRVCLHVFKHNEAAQALYQKLGFKTTGLNLLKKL